MAEIDVYADFSALRRHEVEARDFVILSRPGRSRFAVMAPHGGGIEPGTADIADVLAGNEHAFYAFKGIKKNSNRRLHITSVRFDEPEAAAVAGAADVVVTVHGHHSPDPLVYIGGRHRALKHRLFLSLRECGFKAVIAGQPGLSGESRDNLCNRGRLGKGVQLEITLGLRKRFFQRFEQRSVRCRTGLFYRFIQALSLR